MDDVWSSCSESLETSLGSMSAVRAFIVPLLDVNQLTGLVCRDADIFRGQIATRIQILHSESYLYLSYFLNMS